MTKSRAKRVWHVEKQRQLTQLRAWNTGHLKEIDGYLKEIAKLKEQNSEQEKVLRYTEERNKQLIDQHMDHILVLKGDRDALTRTLEICSRRLSSPAADHDPSRAGWRTLSPLAMGMADDQPMSNEKAIDPAFLRGRRR